MVRVVAFCIASVEFLSRHILVLGNKFLQVLLKAKNDLVLFVASYL